MLPNPQRENPASPELHESIAERLGLPSGPWGAPEDSPPAAPVRPSRLRAVLWWLWQFIFDGFAACGVAMYPCFEDPTDLYDLLRARHREPAKRATEVPAEQSPGQFEALARQRPPIAGQRWDPMLASDGTGPGGLCAEDDGQASP
jgi:hypothetical protein